MNVAPIIFKYLQEMFSYINYVLIILNIYVLFKKIRKKCARQRKELVSCSNPWIWLLLQNYFKIRFEASNIMKIHKVMYYNYI
jgi:hypothetical protein